MTITFVIKIAIVIAMTSLSFRFANHFRRTLSKINIELKLNSDSNSDSNDDSNSSENINDINDNSNDKFFFEFSCQKIWRLKKKSNYYIILYE